MWRGGNTVVISNTDYIRAYVALLQLHVLAA
jgi:hypothetical protein